MLFRTIVNSTKILFIYPLIQPPSPKIKILQNSNFYGVGSEYVKDGKELIVNVLTNKGVSCTTDDTFLQLANKIDTVFNTYSIITSMDVNYILTTTPTIIEIDLTSKKELIIIDHYGYNNNKNIYYYYSCDLTGDNIWGKEITWYMDVPGGSSILYFTLAESKKQLNIKVYNSAHDRYHRIERLIAF